MAPAAGGRWNLSRWILKCIGCAVGVGLLFGSGALDAELGARKEPFGISVYFGRPSPRGLLALILALFIAQVVACAAGVRALMGGRGGHAAGRLSLRTGAGALFFTGLAQTGLLSDSSARRRAVWSLDTVGACLVPNAASGGQQLYTCRRLASATLESEGDGAPSADCLEGRRSWLACFDGSFLCRAPPPPHSLAQQELQLAEKTAGLGGGMRCAERGGLDVVERPRRMLADIRLSSRMGNQMMQYLFARLVADERRLLVRVSRRSPTSSRYHI